MGVIHSIQRCVPVCVVKSNRQGRKERGQEVVSGKRREDEWDRVEREWEEGRKRVGIGEDESGESGGRVRRGDKVNGERRGGEWGEGRK